MQSIETFKFKPEKNGKVTKFEIKKVRHGRLLSLVVQSSNPGFIYKRDGPPDGRKTTEIIKTTFTSPKMFETSNRPHFR